ncbi:MAG: MFS transporter [Desulfovibrionaceae bacterium]|nr:MFS transporter [Desulfovibrionaceae bacterium]
MRSLYLDKNLRIVFGVTLMVIMSVSSIIPVLPSVMTQLGLGPDTVGWVITAFTLPGVLMAPAAGILADRYGRKTVLIPSLFVFGIFGSACFFAPDLKSLLVLRFLQGVGAGPLGVLNYTIIGDLFQGRERAAAMGYNAGALSMGTALFPAVGGLLALIGWRWPFLLPITAIPLGLLAAARLRAPDPEPDPDLGRYFKQALKGMLDKKVLVLYCVTFLTFLILYGPVITYLPVLMDHRFGASPLAIGAVISSSSLLTALAASQLGRLSRRFPMRALLLCSFALYGLAMLLLPLASGLWLCVPPILLFGLAMGLNVPTVLTLLSGLAPMEHRAAFLSVNGMVLRLSQTIAPLLMGAVYALAGLRAVYYAGAGLAAAMLALGVFALAGGRAGPEAQDFVRRPNDSDPNVR